MKIPEAEMPDCFALTGTYPDWRMVSHGAGGFVRFSDYQALYDRMSSPWISVEERLPEPMKQVIVSGGVAYLRGGRWYSITANEWPGKPIQWEVTHWTPLPAPPEAP